MYFIYQINAKVHFLYPFAIFFARPAPFLNAPADQGLFRQGADKATVKLSGLFNI